MLNQGKWRSMRCKVGLVCRSALIICTNMWCAECDSRHNHSPCFHWASSIGRQCVPVLFPRVAISFLLRWPVAQAHCLETEHSGQARFVASWKDPAAASTETKSLAYHCSPRCSEILGPRFPEIATQCPATCQCLNGYPLLKAVKFVV